MDLYQFLISHAHEIRLFLYLLLAGLAVGLLLIPSKMRNVGLELARDTLAAVSHAWRRYRDPKLAAAEDALKDYLAALMSVEIAMALRLSPVIDKVGHKVAKEAKDMLDNSQSFKEMVRIHLATMSDTVIGYVAEGLAKEGPVAADVYATFLKEERAAAQVKRCDVTTHAPRRPALLRP
jgi:hypothetical protein